MSTAMRKIILASASPRRRELLAAAGYDFAVQTPQTGAESGGGDGETPAAMVSRLAMQKAADVASRTRAGLVLGCDTVVECRGRILGKPVDRQHARQMLDALRGSEHRVYSAVCLWEVPGDHHAVRVAVTTLVMAALSDAQIEQYLDSGDWQGKAGAFGYQDGHDWLRIVAGSPSNVVGLPMELLAEMLADLSRQADRRPHS